MDAQVRRPVIPSEKQGGFRLRKPDVSDGSEIWRLVRESQVLDVNSCYAYLLVCRDFADTCVVAEADEELAGFVTGYRPPRHPEIIFVWQVAVSSQAQSQGLGKKMLHHLVRSDGCRDAEFLETTISPSNAPSRRLFQSFAEEVGTSIEKRPGFANSDFPDAHEEEEIYRIGPLPRTS